MLKILSFRALLASSCLFFLLFFLSPQKTLADIVINEVLPNPVGDDNALKPNGEWIELFNTGTETVDVSNWVLYDAVDTHELFISSDNTNGTTTIPSNGWIIIYRNGDSDFSLNNTGSETVRLFNKPIEPGLAPLATFVYDGSTEGKSWGRIPDGSGEIQKLDPTPEKTNNQSITPIPSPTVTPTSTSTPTKPSTPKPATPKPTPTPIATSVSVKLSEKIEESPVPTILQASTSSASPKPSLIPKPIETKVASENNFQKILVVVGLIFIISSGFWFVRFLIAAKRDPASQEKK